MQPPEDDPGRADQTSESEECNRLLGELRLMSYRMRDLEQALQKRSSETRRLHLMKLHTQLLEEMQSKLARLEELGCDLDGL